MRHNTLEAFSIIYSHYDFFASPFIDQSEFQRWAKKAGMVQPIRQLTNTLMQNLRNNHGSLLSTYMFSLVGDVSIPNDVICLKYGDATRLVRLLELNPRFANAIIAIAANDALSKWKLDHHHRRKFPLPINTLMRDTLHLSKLINTVSDNTTSHVEIATQFNALFQKALLNTYDTQRQDDFEKLKILSPVLKQLIQMANKSASLKKRGFLQESTVAMNLVANITKEMNTYLLSTKKPNNSTALFIKISKAHIANASPILEKHRGWKQIIGNLSLAIMGLGVLYLAAIVTNKAVTGNYWFFNQTDSSQKLEQLDMTINNISP
jgi:hypothetical protein